MLNQDFHARYARVEELLCPYVDGIVPNDNPRQPLQPSLYETLFQHRRQLCDMALRTVRTLLDFDCEVLSRYRSEQLGSCPAGQNLAEAIRACAPLVERASDWAALFMLCRERGIKQTETQFARILAAVAPDSPQPSKQTLQSAQWDTNRRRFPDWTGDGVRRSKFLRHYAIAQAASPYLPMT